MFIDIHAHAYRILNPIAPMLTPEQLLERYDQLGIERGVLLPVVSPEVYMAQANEDILEMAQKWPDRFIPFCNIDPRSGKNSSRYDFSKPLIHYKEKGCKGIGEIMPNLPMDDDRVQNLFYHAAEVGLPVTIEGSPKQTGGFGMYIEPGLVQVERTLMSFPKLKMFGHGPVFWSEIGELETMGDRGFFYSFGDLQTGRVPKTPILKEGAVPKLMRRYPNLYGDLSDFTACNALTRDPEYAAKFLDEFQDRLMFGTDFCTKSMKVELCDVLINWRDSGLISETIFNKVARENAIRILELDIK